ncbi:MAG: GNAT family N-acetyltransferase [Actinomycetota bacterium]|nr:GNAT family N-acetyltransferase [Actinomycetota bacterium]
MNSMQDEMVIEELLETGEEALSQLNELIPQLSRSASPLTEEALGRIVSDPDVHLFVARHDGRTVGSLTLVIFPIPTGSRAIIEDVVVDGAARGSGIGEKLVSHALAVAANAGSRTVDLTSRPDREAANRLYQRIGFRLRRTNVYRYQQ